MIAVADGDSFTLLFDNQEQLNVRLADIDAPESGQPYGKHSKKALSELIFGKEVDVQAETTDGYGRTVGRVFVGIENVSEAMVQLGAAWVYRKRPVMPVLTIMER